MSSHSAAVLIPPERQSARLAKKSFSFKGLDPFPSNQKDGFPSLYSGSDEQETVQYDDSDSAPQTHAAVVFESKPQLPSPKIVRRTLEELLSLMYGPYLDLDPDYQRDLVWSKQHMVDLIDSLMENSYIPPVVFHIERAEGSDGATNLKRVCIDGKQRLLSVKAFVDGQIGCHDANGSIWYYRNVLDESGKPVAHQGRKFLPDDVKTEFLQKELVCHEILDLSRSQEQDMFHRLQLGVQLSSDENLRALASCWKRLVKEFEKDYPKVTTLLKTTRTRDFVNILVCFAQILECQHSTSKDGKPTLISKFDMRVSLALDSELLTATTKTHLRLVFRIFEELIEQDSELFADRSNWPGNRRSFARMEMVAVAVLISQHADTRNHDLLSGDIKALRELIRSFTSNITPTSTWKQLWDFIESIDFRDDRSVRHAKRKNVEVASGMSDKRLRLDENRPSTPPDREHLPISALPTDRLKSHEKPSLPSDSIEGTPKRPKGRPRKDSNQPGRNLMRKINRHDVDNQAYDLQQQAIAENTPKRPRGRPRKHNTSPSTADVSAQSSLQSKRSDHARPLGFTTRSDTPTQSPPQFPVLGTFRTTTHALDKVVDSRAIGAERSWARVVRGGPGRQAMPAPFNLPDAMPTRTGSPDSVIGSDEDSDDDTEEEVPPLLTSHRSVKVPSKAPIAQVVSEQQNISVPYIQQSPSSPLKWVPVDATTLNSPSYLQNSAQQPHNSSPRKPTARKTATQEQDPQASLQQKSSLVVQPQASISEVSASVESVPPIQPSPAPIPQSPPPIAVPVPTPEKPAAVAQPVLVPGVSLNLSQVPISVPDEHSLVSKSQAPTADIQTPLAKEPTPMPEIAEPTNPTPNLKCLPPTDQPAPRPVLLPDSQLELLNSSELPPKDTSEASAPVLAPKTVADVKINIVPYVNAFQSGGAKALAERRRLAREARLNKTS